MKSNVLLLIVDSLRAKNTTIHRYPEQTTPFLEKFQESAVTYTQARSPGIWSLPSHASLFTGYQVAEHRFTSRSQCLQPGHTIWEELRDEHGYSTGVFSPNPFITQEDYGLVHGFDTIVRGLAPLTYPFRSAGNPHEFARRTDKTSNAGYLRYAFETRQPIRTLYNGVVYQMDDQLVQNLPGRLQPSDAFSGQDYGNAFLEWHDSQTGPWAACINFTDVHLPYKPQPKFETRGEEARQFDRGFASNRWGFYSGERPWWQCRALQGLYDDCIRQMDAVLERLLNTLKERGDLDDTLVVITSDHGEAFGEQSRVRPDVRLIDHLAGVHESLLHVPLLVSYPELEGGETSAEITSTTEFPAVVRDVVAGTATPESFHTDGPVVASSYHHRLQEYETEALDGYRDRVDLSQFRGPAHAVYAMEGDRLKKSIVWGEDAMTVEVSSAQSAMTVGGDPSERVHRTMADLEDQAIVEGSGEAIDDDTEARLKNLGYA